MKASFSLVILCLGVMTCLGQSPSQDLFSSSDPLKIKLDISFKELREDTNDSTYLDHVIYYEQADGQWDSISVELRKRGHFRLDKCFFPPIKVSIKKKQRKGTLFEDHKKLKLVLPCQNVNENNSLLIKELICYKIYQEITPFSFSTRLVSMELTDHSKKNDRDYQLMGFFIEDDKQVAKRHDGEIMEDAIIHPLRLDDTTAVRHALFQYLIANMDWSTTFQHNAKIMRTDNPYRIIPLAYDFDQSGLVDAAYAVLNPEFESATVNPELEREDIQDRIYRGFCRENDALMYAVRDEFIGLEATIYEIIENYEPYLNNSEYKFLVKFIEKFFVTIKDDKRYQNAILDRCRTE